MKALLVIGNNYTYNENDFKDAYVIGIDKGAKYCLLNNIKMDLALGDFDSVNKDIYNELLKKTKVIKLNPIKDESDTKYAINLVRDYDEIIIVGGISGNRIEHFYANLILLNNYNNLKIIDDNSIIYTKNNDFVILKDEYKFSSFYSLDNSTIISLKGFKYNLCDYKLKMNDPLCLSNEIIDDKAYVSLKGKLLIIRSKDDSNEVVL